jgi:hypothetical protein
LAGQEIFETKIYSTSFPPRLPGNKLALRYRVKSSDLNQATTWSPVYYIDGPAKINATTNALAAATATKFEMDWSDTNIGNYDLFVVTYTDIADYNATINSVTTTKTIYFLAATSSSAFIPQELANFRVGDLIDVFSVNAALDGVNMTVTEINTTSTPYYIRYTGDSSNTLGNTAVTSGYFGIGTSATLEQQSRQYNLLTTYLGTGEIEKSYRFKLVPPTVSGNAAAIYNRIKVIVQLEGIEKKLDSALEIARTPLAQI